ncbi:MAG: FKBP-type peptidyl-prolyl cis-trans isomerase [Bacteroidetes bacterium]|nr:FKBP-type peptidyl-prolyl cis-trans isomerase [Bacteroidota bacterium]MBU1580696.1 FKBP-type peptidyl-prolyl cis-trans isomerase [Bacteroidota bacterium]MBU2556496.1 FKBP-type peptidyl-prolyl cis-trans isomerase [Bacteroidota bacterium]
MKKKSFSVLGIFILLLSVSIFSCSRSPYPGFEEAENGVYINYHEKGEAGEKALLNDVVTLKMKYYLDDTVLFNSNMLQEPLKFAMIEPTFEGDLYAAIELLHIGDSATVVFPADSFYLVTAGIPELPEFVTPGSPMYFDVRLLAIQTEEEVKAEEHEMLEQMKKEEQLLLKDFIASLNDKVEEKESGLFLIEEKKGRGRLPEAGDVLRLHFSVSGIDGMELFSTFEREPMDVTFGEAFDTKGFDEGIGYLRKGGKLKLIVPSSLAFDSVGRGQMVPPYSTLIYEVELMDILSKKQVEREAEAKQKAEEAKAKQAQNEETSKIQTYLKKEKISAKPTPSGLYYVEIEAGTGAQAASGKEVKVHYTLFNIEGKQLQSSREMDQPFSFVLGQGQVIKGWDEGIAMMKAGGKAKLIVPSALAYGATARGEDIPAYSPLVFEVELIEVVEE